MEIEGHFRGVGSSARQWVESWPVADLLRLTPEQIDEVSERFARDQRLVAHPISGPSTRRLVDPANALEGALFTIPLERPVGVEAFMSLTPSRIQRIGGIEPTVRIVPEGVAFVAKSPEQATQIEAVLRANIEQRNADIDAGNRRIVGQVRPLLEQRIEVVRNEEAVAARAWAEAGLQDANRDDEARAEDSVPAPADEFSDAAQSTGARNVDTPVAEGQRADQDIAGDAALLAAVQLVAGTTSSDVKLRAIAQVKGVLQGWIDHTDERRLFGNILLVGLDELEAYVREDTSIAVSSIFDSIQRNIAQAAMWAQTSKYAQLGRDLIMLAQFVQSLIPKS